MSNALEIRLAGAVSQSIHLYVNDAFKAEIVCGTVETEKDLRETVGRARAAQAGLRFLKGILDDWRAAEKAPDGSGSTEKDRREAFAEGLEAGLLDRKREHPMLAGSFMPPDRSSKKAGAAFEQGWSLGQAILRTIAFQVSA